MSTERVHVITPTNGDKVRAICHAINFKKMQLDSLREDSVDRHSVGMDLEALEAALLDYQPENRVGRPG